MKYIINIEDSPVAGKFLFVITPAQISKISAYRSDAIFNSQLEAKLAAMVYLESQGLGGITYQIIASIIEKSA